MATFQELRQDPNYAGLDDATLLRLLAFQQQQDPNYDPVLESRRQAHEQSRMAGQQQDATKRSLSRYRASEGRDIYLPPQAPPPQVAPWASGQANVAASPQAGSNMPPPTPPEIPFTPYGPTPEQLGQVATGRRERRLAEVERNIGPGATEFAPNQFYKGPAFVGSTAKQVRGGRRDNFSNNAGQAVIGAEREGMGTLSMMQANPEILPSSPIQRQAALLRQAQEKAQMAGLGAQTAEAEAAKKAYEGYIKGDTAGLPGAKSQPMEDVLAAQVFNALESARQSGTITPEAYRDAVLKLIQSLVGKYDPLAIFGGSAPAEG